MLVNEQSNPFAHKIYYDNFLIGSLAIQRNVEKRSASGCRQRPSGGDATRQMMIPLFTFAPTDRLRPANGPTYNMFFDKQFASNTFFLVNYSSDRSLLKGAAFANLMNMLTVKMPQAHFLSLKLLRTLLLCSNSHNLRPTPASRTSANVPTYL